MIDPCPACGHPAEEHPFDDRTGERTCSRSLTAPPSCRVCRADLERIAAAMIPS